MEEARALAQQQQQLLLQHQQQQAHNQQQQQQQKQNHHQNQQQFLLLQQLQQQQAAISRFPSNIDAHLRPPGLHRPITLQQQNPNASPNSNPNPSPNPISNSQQHTQINPQQIQQQQQQQQSQQQQQQQQQQQRNIRPLNQVELQMAYQDAWRVCHPDFKRPFTSFEDACERLLPYHVVADYEAEEDDRILDSDTTGQMLSRSQQWDHNIAAKVAEFTGTFEKQALAFNIITRKRAIGEFRSEERLMIEQALLQEEKRAMMELRAELESRERAGREAHEARMRMAAMAQAEQARDEMMARAPIRANALGGSQVNNVSIGRPDIEQEQGGNTDEMMNGWGNNAQRDEKEPSEDFLNDEEAENGDTGMQQEEWREVGEFDLNSR